MAALAYQATGRRKKSVARVRLVPGEGNIIINKRNLEEYFGYETLKTVVRQPLVLTDTLGKYDVEKMTSGDWDLTLFTCTYGGKSRVTVRCQRMV